MFLKTVKFINMYKYVVWHSTNLSEKEDILEKYSGKAEIVIANNLTKNYKKNIYEKKLEKSPGSLNIVYISRIHPMKNLLQALEILKNIEGNITFNIYGPIEDTFYWEECLVVIKELPNNIAVNYNGVIRNDEVNEILKCNHIFFLLTLGENFGHAISEALLGGCPVLISNKTPWRNLETENVGWDLPLDNNEEISKKLDLIIQLNQIEYNEMSEAAFLYGQKESNQEKDIETYKNLFSIEQL